MLEYNWEQISKVHGANMGPTWDLSAQMGPMLAPWALLSGDAHYPCNHLNAISAANADLYSSLSAMQIMVECFLQFNHILTTVGAGAEGMDSHKKKSTTEVLN